MDSSGQVADARRLVWANTTVTLGIPTLPHGHLRCASAAAVADAVADGSSGAAWQPDGTAPAASPPPRASAASCPPWDCAATSSAGVTGSTRSSNCLLYTSPSPRD